MLALRILAESITARGIAAAVFVGALVVGRALRGLAAPRDIVRRGALVRIPRAARRGAKRRHGDPDVAPVRIAGVRIPVADETRHFKILGMTGAGKTTAIRELLHAVLDRGDRAVVTDPNGAYLERFYDPYRGDIILNPFEPRTARWDPFAELATSSDYDDLARSLISQSDDASGREWRGYARTFVAALLRRCDETRRREIEELWRLVAVAGTEELRSLLSGTPAEPFLDPDNARMLGSIRSVAASACAVLEHLRGRRGVRFSITDWTANGRGVLYLPYRAREIAALRSIISTWLRLSIFETLSGREDEEGRLWFIVDELDALGAIDGLKDALARLRRFGGRCVLGVQSIAQISSLYGAGAAQTLVENCGNTLILRCAGSERGGTAHFASRLIGEREIVRRHISRGRDRGPLPGSRALRLSTHVSEQIVTEAAVLPAELEQLPDLAGYLKTASRTHWIRIRLDRKPLRWRSTISG